MDGMIRHPCLSIPSLSSIMPGLTWHTVPRWVECGVWVQSFEDHHIDKSIGLRCNVVFTIKLTGPACYTKFVCSAMRMVRAASLGNEVDI